MIVLDTHAWVWWAGGSPRLSREARKAITRAGAVIVPTICAYELARLAWAGELKLDREPLAWVQDSLENRGVRLAELLPEIAVRAARLGPNFPGDPVDRMVVATAVHHGLPLVTADENIARSGVVSVVW